MRIIENPNPLPTTEHVCAKCQCKFEYTEQDVGRHVYAVRQTGLDLGGIHLDRTVGELIVEVTDNGDGTWTVIVKRGGGVRFEVSETGNKKDWARRHVVRGVVGRRAKACYGVEFTTGDNPRQGGRIEFRANGISGSVVVEGLAIYEMSREGTLPGKQKRKEEQP
jgi:hypothetical protein